LQPPFSLARSKTTAIHRSSDSMSKNRRL
jgi:hypothetical protein